MITFGHLLKGGDERRSENDSEVFNLGNMVNGEIIN